MWVLEGLLKLIHLDVVITHTVTASTEIGPPLIRLEDQSPKTKIQYIYMIRLTNKMAWVHSRLSLAKSSFR